jgi:hypothetical protein
MCGWLTTKYLIVSGHLYKILKPLNQVVTMCTTCFNIKEVCMHSAEVASLLVSCILTINSKYLLLLLLLLFFFY